jgi:hypothetical protein
VAVEDLGVAGAGTWCYSVFTLDRRQRWRPAGTRIVRRGAERPLAARVDLRATVAAPSGVRLQWINPTTPVASIQVLRARGACATVARQLQPISTAPRAAGPAAFVDAAATSGTWCYGLRFRTVAASARPLLATVQIART